jgi:hypothetical protein
MRVHRQQREVDVVRFGDGAAGAVLVYIADLEVFQVAALRGAVALGGNFDGLEHERVLLSN